MTVGHSIETATADPLSHRAIPVRLIRRRLVAIGIVFIAAGVLLAAEAYRRQSRLNRLIEKITASGGFVMVETPQWQKYVAS